MSTAMAIPASRAFLHQGLLGARSPAGAMQPLPLGFQGARQPLAEPSVPPAWPHSMSRAPSSGGGRSLLGSSPFGKSVDMVDIAARLMGGAGPLLMTWRLS